MTPKRFHLVAAVHILLVKDKKVFLLRRKNTGWEDGKYSIIGGHLEGNETATQAAIREVKEEAGIAVEPQDLIFFNVSHLVTNSERIQFSFAVTKWQGTPKNNEPEKADAVQWFSLDKLPSNITDVSKETIAWYKNGIVYTEFGWGETRVVL